MAMTAETVPSRGLNVRTSQPVRAAPPAARRPPPSDARGGGRVIAPAFLLPWSVPLACLTTLGLHLLFLTRQLGIDEGGYAMVARFWRTPGAFLYGPQWVDRPPGLILVFDLADHLGPYGARLTAAATAVLLVLAVGVAADALAGPSAARWAAWTACALASSALLDTERLDGELIAAAFVAASIAALVFGHRARHPVARLLLGVAAGAAAAAAVLAKQNFVDAFAFAVVLLAVTLVRVRRQRARTRAVLATGAAFVAGAAVPAAAAGLWATAHGGVSRLVYAMYGFRADSTRVMADWSWRAPLHRLGLLVIVAVLSGLLGLVLHLLVSHSRALTTGSPLAWAITVAVVVETVGVAGGENFWPHYLIALVPTVALAAGVSAAGVSAAGVSAAGVSTATAAGRTTKSYALLCLVSTLVATPVIALHQAEHPSASYATGRWLAASAHPGDSVTVPFTHANLIDASGLRPGYPYAWSLPVRTLDPRLSLLVRDLDGRHAPTWVVLWNSPHAWALRGGDRVHASLHRHYLEVADVCGHGVWLHRGAVRTLAAVPTRSVCGAARHGFQSRGLTPVRAGSAGSR